MFPKIKFNILIISICFWSSCQEANSQEKQVPTDDLAMCYSSTKGNNFINIKALEEIKNMEPNQDKASDFSGMVKVTGGSFKMGGNKRENPKVNLAGMQPREDEFPIHKITVNDFWIDETEVTNAQFKKFVEATNYVTTAERPIPLEEIMAQLPEGTEPPSPDLLVPASLVFESPINSSGRNLNAQDWWKIVKEANWRQPQGPGSSIEGKEDLPAIHISWYDAMAYAKWAGKRLPTEAEWEYAGRGGKANEIFPWGNDFDETQNLKANFWQGNFPFENKATDGFEKLAPVKSFPPNSYGLFDMAGNVWEWCNDWYHAEYYQCLEDSKIENNPSGPEKSFDPYMPASSQKILRGGSFLCNDSYCSGYRVAARMKSSPDTGLEHTGFRCVRDVKN